MKLDMSFSEWTKYKLGDFAELRKEQIPPKGKEQVYIGLEHIEQQTLRINGVGSSNDVISNKFKFYSGDVLYGKLRPYFRKVYQPKFEGVCSTDIYVIKNKQGFDSSFLFYLVATEEFTKIANSGSTGTRMPRADWNQLKVSEWLIPELPTQQKIASILSSLDDKIELNNKTNQTLEAMAQSLFKEMCLPKDESQKDWRVGKLGEIMENFDSKRKPLSSREREKRKGKYPYYGAASIVDYVDDYLFEGIYLLFGEDGSVITAEEKPILQYVTGKFWVNNHTHVLRGIKEYSTEFLYLLLKNTNVRKLVTGAVQPKINQGNMNALEIIIPSKNVVEKLNGLVQPIFENILINQQENQTLAKLRNDLIPKLFKGEIKI